MSKATPAAPEVQDRECQADLSPRDESPLISDQEKLAQVRKRCADVRQLNSEKIRVGGFVNVATAYIEDKEWLIGELDRLTEMMTTRPVRGRRAAQGGEQAGE